ncbi:MAG: type II secretion system F family protein, partial [Flavobacteriaceae bacterium]|nr:type II secretion system F family protein [Flavobacteriaceae bacterium]
MGIKFETHTVQSKSSNTSSGIKNLMQKDIHFFGSSFSNKKKESFYGRLSVLLKSGINLKKALELISESQKKDKDQLFIFNLSQEIVAGKSLYEVMEAHPHFTAYEYQAVKIGEQTGKIYDITNDLFSFYKQKNEQKRQVYSALSHPIVILFTAIIVVYFMMQFVVPMFVDIFKQQKVELPWITQVIVDISNFITSYGGFIIIFFLTLPFPFRYLKKQSWYRQRADTFKLKIPILGSYLRKVYVTQFVQAMSLLTKAKVPMVNGISLVRNMIEFYPLQSSLEKIEKNIIEG